MTTFEHLMRVRSRALTSLRQVRLANPSRAPASVTELATSAGSGTTLSEWSASVGPDGVSLRIRQASFPSMEDMPSSESSAAYTRSGMLCGGKLFRLAPLVRHIGGTASGSSVWPTPVANDDNKSPAAHMAMKARMKGGPRYKPTSLQVMAKGIGQGLWSTPTTTPTNSPTGPEATSSNPGPSLWRTPTSAMAQSGTTNAEMARELGQTVKLSDQAKTPSLWPTPTANDRIGAGYQKSGGKTYPTLPGAAGATAHYNPETNQAGKDSNSPNGRLSCALVTYLMGFPMNWFDPSPATVPKSSKPWATPSSPKSPPSS